MNSQSSEAATHWKDKRVFITGATGLLGSQLTKTLVSHGAKVTVLVLDQQADSVLVQSDIWHKVNVVRGALQSYETLVRVLHDYEIEYVFHLGAQTQVTHANQWPLETLESNVRGTYNILEACRQYGRIKCLMVASSDKAYGSQEILPYAEDAPMLGLHPYDASKSCADILARTYFNTYKLPVCVTRCGNLYGPGDLNFIRIIPEAIKAAYENKPLQLRSDGTFIRDYLFVEDAVDGYLTVAQNVHRPDVVGHAFNLSTGNKLRVLDVVAAVSKASGHHIEVKVLNVAKGEIKDQYLSSEKAKRVLNWTPKHTIEQGLAKTVPAYFHFFKTGRWEQ